MTLAELLMMCAVGVPGPTRDLMYQIASGHSGGDPYLIVDHSTGKTHRPGSKAEAVRIATVLLEAHHDVRLGVMGLGPDHVKKLRLSPARVFDPCENVGAAARVLTKAPPRDLDRRHAYLATYYAPSQPMSEHALAFGSRVLAQEPVQVAREVRARHPRASFVYEAPGGLGKPSEPASSLVLRFEKAPRPKKWPGKKAAPDTKPAPRRKQ